MKIAKQNLFATPKSLKAIEDWIELHPAEDRIHLYTVMGMTWNYLAEVINEVEEDAA